MRRILVLALTGALAITGAHAQTQAPAAAPVAATPPQPAFLPGITITPERPSGLFAVDETVRWTVRAPLGMPNARYAYEVRENNLAVLSSGTLDLSRGMDRVEGALSRPGIISMVLRPVPPADGPAPNVTPFAQAAMSAAAAVGIRDITAPARPADFRQFWDAKLAALRAVPMNPRLTAVESGNADVSLSMVALDALNSQTQGYLAIPRTGNGKYPALVIFQYAGVYPLQKETSVNRAAEGWLAFNVTSHDMRPDEDTAPRNYAGLGNTDRETSYFLNMYLRDVRAIEYIRNHPNWDGRTVVVMGTSMGGQQSFAVAGLVPDGINAMIVNVPSGANIVGDVRGARQGYPNWASSDPKVFSTAPYFDAMSFAPDIRAAALVAPGFLDITSPPYGIIAAFNAIQGPKELIAMVDSDHNHITPQKQDAWHVRSRDVLEELRMTGRFTPAR